VDHTRLIQKFYASANAVCSHAKFASHMSVIFLLETFCLPLLSHCCEVVGYNKHQLGQMNVCWNNAYRKVFRMNAWESVKELHLWKASRLDNGIFRACYLSYSRSMEFSQLVCDFNVVVCSSSLGIKTECF